MPRTRFNVDMMKPGSPGFIMATNIGGTDVEFTDTLPDGTLATTQAPGDNSTAVATTAYTDAAVVAGNGVGVPVSAIYSDEVPAGAIDGLNTAFTLANTPEPNTFALHIDGMLYQAGVDYTLAGASLTMVTPPVPGQVMLASYVETGTVGNVHGLTQHTDVDLAGLVSGEHLRYDGSNFVPQAPAYSRITPLHQVHSIIPAGTASSPHLLIPGGPVSPVGASDDLAPIFSWEDLPGAIGLADTFASSSLDVTVSYNGTAVGSDLLVELVPVVIGATTGPPGTIVLTLGAPASSVLFTGPDIAPSQTLKLGAVTALPDDLYVLVVTPTTGATAAGSHVSMTASVSYYNV